uniref:C2H2-type domain-containing protein n=2 Tax=Xenopsylla cheopis TaxID=163159 RepID=A0A6M2DLX0_XENCH
MTKAKEKSRPYECTDCSKRFLSKNDLRKHSRTHSGERPYGCKDCGRRFRQAVALRNHITCHHSSSLDEKTELFICEYCKKVFPLKERLSLHLRVHTGYKPYQCPNCPMRFARGGQLKQHSYTHSGLRPYKCKHCTATFTTSGNLKLHVNRHLEVRDYTCHQCGKSFIRPDALRKHLTCFHDNVKTFHCDICNKEFKGHLPQHLRTHFQEKPHGCSACGATFAQRSHLIVHQRTHSGEKPYRCQVCWKAFAHSTALRLHIRRHTGEKPYKCKLCKDDLVAFSQLPHLKKHMLCIHKTNKPYVCDNCEGFFRTKIDLNEHATECLKDDKEDDDLNSAEAIDRAVRERYKPIDPPMALEKMRLLLSILLQRISSPDKLQKLGFNKLLIDDVLIASIKSSGREPCNQSDISPAERLKRNVQILLDWTVPKQYMEEFRKQQRSTEELLQELTS